MEAEKQTTLKSKVLRVLFLIAVFILVFTASCYGCNHAVQWVKTHHICDSACPLHGKQKKSHEVPRGTKRAKRAIPHNADPAPQSTQKATPRSGKPAPTPRNTPTRRLAEPTRPFKGLGQEPMPRSTASARPANPQTASPRPPCVGLTIREILGGEALVTTVNKEDCNME